MNDTRPNPKRRWLRLSVQALLVFLLLLSVPVGRFAWQMQQAREQRKAIEAIVQLGGKVTYDYRYDETGERILPPEWLRKTLGDDFFLRVGIVECHSTAFGDDHVVHLQSMENLRLLYLRNTSITDTGLQQLKGLTDLESVELSDTHVTDGGVDVFRRALPNCAVTR